MEYVSQPSTFFIVPDRNTFRPSVLSIFASTRVAVLSGIGLKITSQFHSISTAFCFRKRHNQPPWNANICLSFAVSFTIAAASSVASPTIWSHYANFKVSSLFISQWKLIVFTVNEHENIGIAGLNPQTARP